LSIVMIACMKNDGTRAGGRRARLGGALSLDVLEAIRVPVMSKRPLDDRDLFVWCSDGGWGRWIRALGLLYAPLIMRVLVGWSFVVFVVLMHVGGRT
jgi:hypothetical protein